MFENEKIFSYSRKQAIQDGVLVDITDAAKKAGFVIPVAVTRSVQVMLENIPKKRTCQSYEGRLWDVLISLRYKISLLKPESDILIFEVLMYAPKKKLIKLKSVIGPGDTLAPVLTIMFTYED